MLLYVATTNQHKIREFVQVRDQENLRTLNIEPLPGLSAIPVPEEVGHTFEENASAKATHYSQFTALPIVAEDSGLEVEWLKGAPGVRSARFAGDGAADSQNNALLLQSLGSAADRRARYVSVIALARDGQVLHLARGSVEGEILQGEQGTNGFGYDPLFFYPPLQRSFGELTVSEKFRVSHRGNAVRALFSWIATQSWFCQP
jgi:XTP/dITP diphosphohydrolase